MRSFVRLAGILGSMSISGLAALSFPSIASAQGPHQHHGSPSVNVVAASAHDLAVGIAHGATLGAVVFLAGLVMFVTLVWLPVRRVEDADRGKAVNLLCRWMWVLVGLLVVAGLVELPLYALRASGETLSPGLLEEALLDTRVGQLWIARLTLGILTAAVATYAAHQPQRTAYWWGVTVVVSVLLLTLTQQSHAVAEGGFLPIAADWLHVMAASLWMGGLLGFPILLIGPLRMMSAEARSKVLGRTVPRFSKMATLAVMSLILTGLVAILLHVPSVEGLLGSTYGWALMIKLGLAVFLFAAGGANLLLRGRGPFGRIVGIELILALCIFVATGFLTSLPPADADQQPGEENEAAPAESVRQSSIPAAPAQQIEGAASKVDVVVRVSGTPGIRYSGAYGEPIEGTQVVTAPSGLSPRITS